MKALDNGIIKDGMITYTALPCPLPETWRKEFIDCATRHKGDYAKLAALEIRCREAIGFEHTRKFIRSIQLTKMESLQDKR